MPDPSVLPGRKPADRRGQVRHRLLVTELGGSDYTGRNAGTLLNDDDGDFGPHFGSRLPTATAAALAFTRPASAMSTTNSADYSITAAAATFTTSNGVSRPLPSEVIFGDRFES